MAAFDPEHCEAGFSAGWQGYVWDGQSDHRHQPLKEPDDIIRIIDRVKTTGC